MQGNRPVLRVWLGGGFQNKKLIFPTYMTIFYTLFSIHIRVSTRGRRLQLEGDGFCFVYFWLGEGGHEPGVPTSIYTSVFMP